MLTSVHDVQGVNVCERKSFIVGQKKQTVEKKQMVKRERRKSIRATFYYISLWSDGGKGKNIFKLSTVLAIDLANHILDHPFR